MRFYLGVWSTPAAITDKQAASHYVAITKGDPARAAFDPRVYGFYRQLTQVYPELDSLSEDEVDDSPWACGLDFTGAHLIMAIVPQQSETVLSNVLVLAEQHGLACFDPQASKVYLPPHLRARQAGACVISAQQPG